MIIRGYVILFYVVLCYVMLSDATSSDVICYVMLCYLILCYAMLCCIMLLMNSARNPVWAVGLANFLVRQTLIPGWTLFDNFSCLCLLCGLLLIWCQHPAAAAAHPRPYLGKTEDPQD